MFRGTKTIRFLFIPIFLLSVYCAYGQKESIELSDLITFEGTVLEKGVEPNFDSGVLTAYQSIKYRIDKIIEGEFEAKEVTLEHIVLERKDHRKIKEGKKVCVVFGKTFDDGDNLIYSGRVYRKIKKSPCYKRTK